MMEKELRKERENIASMFNSIAAKYDLLNLILSFGIDTIWRRRLIRRVVSAKPLKILDIACGTGDLILKFSKMGYSVYGADISMNMLEVAKEKALKMGLTPEFVLASADDLPFENNLFGAVTISFGIRNFEDRNRALKEIHRTMKEGGVLAILEFAQPRNPLWSAVYKFYLAVFVPLAGRLISGDKKAYRYLSDSIVAFPKFESFCAEIETVGFKKVGYQSMSGGIAVLYTAYK